MISSYTSAQKPHFKILDGLRGIAAIAVVVFHFAEWVYPPEVNLIGHGFLAVDFFFCLSGFVIAYAYDNQLEKIGVLSFIKRRLIRLHPLIILGGILGLIGYLVDPLSNSASNYSLTEMVTLFVCTIFLIPYPVMEDKYFNLFGLNPPTWSLFWEYVANILYAFVLLRLSKHLLLLLTVIAAAILGYISYSAGNLLGGWDGTTFWHGGARIFFSFCAGMCIYRYNLIIKNKLGFIGLSVLLLLSFMAPHPSWNWLLEVLIVIIYLPLIVMLGAGSHLSPKLEKLCDFSGRISYPLYMTHYFGIALFGSYYLAKSPSNNEVLLITFFGTLTLVGFAYLAMIVYDIPLRKYLSTRK